MPSAIWIRPRGDRRSLPFLSGYKHHQPTVVRRLVLAPLKGRQSFAVDGIDLVDFLAHGSVSEFRQLAAHRLSYAELRARDLKQS